MNIRFEANISKYEANIYPFEANKPGIIRLFRMEANQQILPPKLIKNGSECSFLSEYFIYF